MDLGTLQYNVEADTTGLDKADDAMESMAENAKKASKEMDDLGDKTEKAAKRSSGATKQMQEEVKKLTASTEKQSAAVAKYGKDADIAYDSASSSIKEAAAVQKTALAEQAKAAEKAGGALRGMRGIAQSAGYQLQDIAVQAQMGTNAFVILGQQGSQFASAFGPTGAVVGAVLAVGSAIGGVLFASLMAASKAVEELEDNVKSLIKEYDQLTLAQQGIVNRGVGLAIDDLTKKYKEEQEAIDDVAKSIALMKEVNKAFLQDGRTDIGATVAVNQMEEATRKLVALQSQQIVTERQIAALRDPTGAEKKINQLNDEAELVGKTGKEYWQLKAAQEGVASAYVEAYVAANLLLEARKKEQEQIKDLHKAFDDEIDARVAAQKKLNDEEEKRAASVDKQIKQLEKQNKLFDDQSVYASILEDINSGLIKVTESEQKRLLAAAKISDQLRAQKEEQKEYVDAYKKWVDDQYKAQEDADEKLKKLGEDRVKAAEQQQERIGEFTVGILRDSLDGTEDLFDGVVSLFKNMLAEMAYEGALKPIVLNLQSQMTSGGGQASASQAGSAISAGGIYAAIAVAVVAGANIWNKKQDEIALKMTAEYRQGSQSLGTILGEGNRKSDSLGASISELESTANTTLGVNNQMLSALIDIRTGIAGVAAGFSRTLTGMGEFGVNQSSGTLGLNSWHKNAGESIFRGLANPAAGLIGLDSPIADFVTGFMGGIVDKIDKAFYSNKKKVIDSGIEFGGGTLADIIQEGTIAAFAYADVQIKKKTFGITTSNKVKTQTEDLNEILLGQFADVFAGAGSALEQAAGVFGLDFQNYINRLIIDPQKLSLKGLEGEALTKEIESFFSSTLDNWAGVLVSGTDTLSKFQQVGEGAFETVIRLASELNTFNYYAEALDLNFSAVGFAAVDASQNIAELSGGFDKLNASMSSYYSNFFTEEERASRQMDAFAAELAKIGINTVPATRAAFRDLVEGIDLSTAAGQEQFASLINLQGVFADLTKETDKLADSGYDLLARSVAAEKKLIAAQTDVINESLSASRDIYNALDGTLKGMFASNASTQLISQKQGQSSLAAMLGTARAGGSLNLDQLNSALGAAGNPATKFYATFEDYATDLYKTSALIGELKDITGEQISDEELALQNLESQTEYLDGILEWSKAQVDILNGIDTSITSVSDALKNFSGINGLAMPSNEQLVSFTEAANKTANFTEALRVDMANNAAAQNTTNKEFQEFMKSTQVAIVDNTLQTKKVLQKFDAIGMPPVREDT